VIALFATTVLVCYLLIPNELPYYVQSADSRAHPVRGTHHCGPDFRLSLWPCALYSTRCRSAGLDEPQTNAPRRRFVDKASTNWIRWRCARWMRVIEGHGHFFLWYWPAVALEALLLGLAGRQYGEWSRRGVAGRVYGYLAEAVILPLVSYELQASFDCSPASCHGQGWRYDRC
jgi:hypothetical protein